MWANMAQAKENMNAGQNDQGCQFEISSSKRTHLHGWKALPHLTTQGFKKKKKKWPLRVSQAWCARTLESPVLMSSAVDFVSHAWGTGPSGWGKGGF